MTKLTKWVCAQRRLRSAWASAQSDQSFRCVLNEKLRTQAFFMRTAKALIRLGGCPGWSESSLGAQSLCWYCHVAAQLVKLFTGQMENHKRINYTQLQKTHYSHLDQIQTRNKRDHYPSNDINQFKQPYLQGSMKLTLFRKIDLTPL